MFVELAYGREGLRVDLPEKNTVVIEPEFVEPLPEEIPSLRQALRKPLHCPPLREIVKRQDHVAVAVCDITRPMPSARVLPVLLEELLHVPAEQVSILVATGTHRTNSREELLEMLGPRVVDAYSVVNHVATDESALKPIGELREGGKIWINRRWLESDVRITTGFVEPHFFAGFSGGPKLVAPGLAGLETVMHLHSAALIGDPRSTWGVTEGNPIHDAIRSIAAQTEVTFSLDVTLNRDHRITNVFAGEIFSAHREACRFVRRTAMRPVKKPFDLVVTTNSGYPLDLNLYQSVKGMSAAARIVREGGTIICAAECSEGVPEEGRYKQILASCDGPEEILQRIHSPGYSCQDQWQAQIQAQIQLRARVYLKSSGLSAGQIRAAHLEPVDDVEALVAREVARRGGDASICVLPQGPQTIPYLSGGL